jgi:hypothetical protein
LKADLSHSGFGPWTTAAAINGHSAVGLADDRFTLQTGYSDMTDLGPTANDRKGSWRPHTVVALPSLTVFLAEGKQLGGT